VRHGGTDGCQGDGGAVGVSAYDSTKGVTQAVGHSNGDVVEAGARVVVGGQAATHVVLSGFSVFHSLFWRENRRRLCEAKRKTAESSVRQREKRRARGNRRGGNRP